MSVKLTNNASSTLAASITNSELSLTIQASDAGKFPTLGTGQWHPLTIVDASNNMEVVKVTGRSGPTLTIVRAQEATTGKAFPAGARVDVRATAAIFTEISSHISTLETGLSTANTNIATKATTSALTALSNTVTSIQEALASLTTTVGTKLNLAGGTLTGHLRLYYTSADPSSLGNGDFWIRNTGVFARIAGVTHKLLSNTGNQSITGNLTTSGTVVATGNVQTSGKFIGDGSSLSSLPLNGMGIGQTWRNYTTSREHGTTYTNSTTKPIMVNINTPGWNCDAQVRTSSTASWVSVSMGENGGTQSFIVPVGHQYRLTSEHSLHVWSELR